MIIAILALPILIFSWFFLMFLLILSGSFRKKTVKNATVIVLGAQVKPNGPSTSFRLRLDKAAEYLRLNENSVCIVSGGKGMDEPCSEAMCGKDYLTKIGIDEKRILLEDKSVNTKENLLFSKKILPDNNLSNKVAVSTQDFHMFRSLSLAKDLGYNAFALVSKSTRKIYPIHAFREIFALTNYYYRKILRKG